jgi:alpha-tubulin suppressor-like RCC1 family protein
VIDITPASTAALLPFQGQLMRPRLLVVPLLVAVSACSDYSTSPNGGSPSFEIADAARDYKEGFYWLPPMVRQPTVSGTFDASLAPTVAICELVDDACGPVLATYTMTSGPGGELVRLQDGHYHVNWHTNEFTLSTTNSYRISVRAGVNGVLLGYADVQPAANGSGFKNLDSNELMGLVDGRTLPIKFRIETNVVGGVAVAPLEATLEAGGTQQFVASVTDLYGNPMSAGVIWSSSDESVAIVDQFGIATAVGEGTAIITATAQRVSGSATLTVEAPTPVVGSIDVAPVAVTLQPGNTQQYEAIVRDTDGNPMTADVVWTSSDESISTVDQAGLVTAISAGTATITATVGSVSGSGTLTVEAPAPVVGSVEVIPPSVALQPGNTQQYQAIVRDTRGNPMTANVVWSSSNESVAMVDQSGLVTALSEGTATITATVENVSGNATLIVEAPVEEGVVRVSAGDSHSCAINQDGVAFCWGLGSSGQLGNGFLISRSTPFPVAGGHTFTTIVAAETHSCALTATGQAYCWGLNNVGQLGDGTTTNQPSPTLVASGLTFTSIAAGAFHTCALSASGEAYCWGFSTSGALGNGATAVRTSPIAVSGGHRFVSLTAGRSHTCGITTTGETYCWGLNSSGQLGDGTTGNRLSPSLVIGGLTFVSISAGDSHTCALTASGSAYCWGSADGRLGIGDPAGANTTSPQSVTGGLTFTAIAAGETHSCAIATSGEAYCWGSNTGGRLGIGTTDPQSLVPVPVAGGHVFRSIDVSDHSCAVTTTNQVYCWGPGGNGRLGNGSTVNQPAPTPIAPFPES